MHKSIHRVFPFFSHHSSQIDPPCSCAAGQLSLPVWPFGSHIEKKKTANLSRRHNCHYDCCGPAHHTQCTDCSTEKEGANTVCSVQTPHNIIIAWLQLIHTLTQSLYLTHFCLLGLTNFSIKHRANKHFYRAKNPYSTAFKKSLTVKPWVNTHSHSATANRKW